MTEEEELAELRIDLARAQGNLAGFTRGILLGFIDGVLITVAIAAFLVALWEKFHG